MLGPQCTENPPAIGLSREAENVQEIGGLNTYVSGDEDSKCAIILASDAYGFEAPKLRKLADKIAASGFFVVVPDFFHGDPLTPEKPTELWLKAHSPDKGCEEAMTIAAALRNRGVSKIGVAGFCWGGMVAVRLSKFDCIQAVVLLHPGPITAEEINEVRIPIAILGAEIDHIAPAELLKQLGEILSAKGEVDSLVKIFPGVGHGWTVRYDDNDEFAVKSAQESHQDLLNWLTKHVK